MEAIWGDLLEMHSARYDKNVQHAFTKSGSRSAIHLIHPLKERIHHNCELYLSSIATIVLNNARPSGYFEVSDTNHTVIDSCSNHGPQGAQPDDIVNYLACSCVEELLEDKACITPNPAREAGIKDGHFIYSPLTCLSVAFVRGIQLPLSAVYKEACKARQLVPPRYQHCFPSGTCRLSDLNALQLLADCRLQPRKLEIFSPAFDSLISRKHSSMEKTSVKDLLSVLSRVFVNVQSLKTHGFGNQQAPLAVLAAILMNKNIALSVLDVRGLDNTLVQSLARLLSAESTNTTFRLWEAPFNTSNMQAPFCALTELRLDFVGLLQPIHTSAGESFPQGIGENSIGILASIVEDQEILEKLTIANISYQASSGRLYAALQSFCQYKTFRSLSLHNVALPVEAAIGILCSFLVSPCISTQSLELDSIGNMEEAANFSDDKFIQIPFSTHPAFDCSSESEYHLFPQKKTPGSTHPSEVPIHVSNCALEHKSLVLRSTPLLAAWLLHQKEVKLKSLTVNPADSSRSRFPVTARQAKQLEEKMQHVFTLIVYHPNLHIQDLILPISTSDRTEDFEALLVNPSLRKLECVCNTVSALAAGLLKQAEIGTLRELSVFCHHQPINLDLGFSSFFSALLSLPQLHILSVKLTLTRIHWVECMYEVWKEKRPILPDFTVCTSVASELNVNDAQKYMLDEMGVKFLLEKN